MEGLSSGSVEAAGAASCATASVKGLSFQIIEEGNCIEPGAFAPFALPANAKAQGERVSVHPEARARRAGSSVLAANAGKAFTVNSMLRTIAQQYLLWSWYQSGSCGIPLAAKPGNSNHETGLAMDVQEYSAWRRALESNGFYWLGSSDPWHFDWVGASTVESSRARYPGLSAVMKPQQPEGRDKRGRVVGAVDREPDAKITADGFPIGATCGAPSEPSCKASFSNMRLPAPIVDRLDGEGGADDGLRRREIFPDLTVTRGQWRRSWRRR